MSLAEAAALYEAAQYATATRELVEDANVRLFVKAARLLLRLTGSDPDDELLVALSRRIRRARWDIHSIPLPLTSTKVALGESATAIDQLLRRAAGSYGNELASAGDGVVQVARGLWKLDANPLGDRSAEILATGDASRSAVLVRRPEHATAIESWLRREVGAPVRVISQEQLNAMAPFETLVVVGPARWYQRYVLAAPRAEQLCFVHYAWVNDDKTQESLFDGSRSTGVERPIRVATPASHRAGDEDDGIEADSLLPEIDWTAIASVATADAKPGDEAEAVRANLYLLGGGYSVCLEADDGPTIYVIDLAAEGAARVRREPTRSIAAGDYILVRSARGAEDYVQAVANKKLGADAKRLRGLQLEWKAALRRRVALKGIAGVVRDLKAAGTRVQNVSYWMSPENIKTQYPSDFKALMEYCGLGGRAGEIWAAMDRISDAHTWAGGEIRRLLEKQVLSSDLSQLRRDGYIDFELEGAEAGALTIFRVEARNPEPVLVPRSWLRWPEPVEADHWPG